MTKLNIHTPAPWTPRFTGNNWFIDNNNRQITCADEVDDEDKANAHLIAAAPELLETLESISDWILDNVEVTTAGYEFNNKLVNDAIQKALKLLEQVEQGGCKIDSKNYVDLCHEDLEHIENKYILIEREK